MYILLALALLDVILIATGRMGALGVLLTTGLVGYGLIRGAREALKRSKIIWRLRNRLFVTYIFVGAVPIVLILALAACGIYIVIGQVATYLVSAELTRRAVSLENPARILTESAASRRPEIMRQMGPILRDRFPGLDVMVTGDPNFPSPPPDWHIFSGVVRKGGEYDWIAVCRRAATEAIVTAPLSADSLGKAIPGLGVVQLGSQTAGRLPPAMNSLDFEVIWLNQIEVADWSRPNRFDTESLTVNTRPSAVLSVVFADRPEAAQTAMIVFIAIAVLLAVVELGSVVIGITMTRTITGAVHNLYEGTQRIAHGDFSHRIPVEGYDQLASLGKSFNEMSEQLESLVKVTREKERLESELTIASEVQNQLFPRAAPPMKTIELIGACIPARSVSGDYYDYLLLPNGNLAVAIGDVAGKGISAALLMASIQSIMRTQLAQGVPVLVGAGGANGDCAPQFSTASVVSQLNRQLYANTSPEKYATFFFGLYDEKSRVMTYTNAGHLPPLLVCGGEAHPLEVTGTVVGLFPSISYEEKTIRMCPDDMLIAYTDGITEPENAYGEEFGVDRLSETVLRNRKCEPVEIVAKVMEAVKHWSNAPELPDDMTVLIAKAIAS